MASKALTTKPPRKNPNLKQSQLSCIDLQTELRLSFCKNKRSISLTSDTAVAHAQRPAWSAHHCQGLLSSRAISKHAAAAPLQAAKHVGHAALCSTTRSHTSILVDQPHRSTALIITIHYMSSLCIGPARCRDEALLAPFKKCDMQQNPGHAQQGATIPRLPACCTRQCAPGTLRAVPSSRQCCTAHHLLKKAMLAAQPGHPTDYCLARARPWSEPPTRASGMHAPPKHGSYACAPTNHVAQLVGWGTQPATPPPVHQSSHIASRHSGACCS